MTPSIIFKTLTLLIFCLTSHFSTAQVTFYSEAKYWGDKVSLKEGNHTKLPPIRTKGRVSSIDDRISSIKIPEGWKVVAYEHTNFRGKSITLTKSSSNLQSLNFNDKISSVRISIASTSKSNRRGSLRDRFKKPLKSTGDKMVSEGMAKAPTITSIVSTSQGMQVKFTASDTKIRRLSVFRKDMEDDNFVLVKAVTPNARTSSYSILDDGRNLKRGSQYCYEIRAWNNGQVNPTKSKGKASCTFFDGDFRPPNRPKNPTKLKLVTTTSKSATISFQDQSNNEEYFFLERKEPHHADWVVTAVGQVSTGVGKVVTMENISLEMEQTYLYRLRAVNDAGTALSKTIRVKTAPIEFKNSKVRITHPSKNTLAIYWIHDKPDKLNWKVLLYNSDNLQNPIKTNTLTGNGNLNSSFGNLDPSKQYCIKINSNSNSVVFKSICDSPFAERTEKNQTSPNVPAITSIERIKSNPNNTQLSPNLLKVNLNYGVEGQRIDIINMEKDSRETVVYGQDGRKSIVVGGLLSGTNYCFRVFTTNKYGTRYSPTKCRATILSTPTKPHITNISDNHVITVEWTVFREKENILHFSGTKSGASNHEGTISLIPPYNYYDFPAKPNFSYCFKVKAKNDFDTTDWSPSLCGVISKEVQPTTPTEEVVSFASSLIADIPPSGKIIYLGQVKPGQKARLRKVHIAGNTFTPYIVQFLPEGEDRNACGTNIGVRIEPGKDLKGNDLKELYGSTEPKTPIYFGACKLSKTGKVLDTKKIPIQITYVKE